MNDIIQQLKEKYRYGEINIKLIFICVGVFLIGSLLGLIPLNIETFFAVNPQVPQLFMQLWGVVTYTFFHGDFFHLLINMLMIYVVGRLFLRYFRKEDFLTFFIFGSISGAVLFIAFSSIFNYSDYLIGASAAIYSVFFALISYMPKNRIQLFFIPVNIPLDYVGYILLAWDGLMILTNNNTGGHISHLGGAAFGYLYMKQFEKGNDFFGKITRFLFFQPKIKTQKTRKTPPRDDYEFNSQKVEKQKKIDKILDKISRSGYESLTKEEKDFLFKAGK